jgi:hypothetical protein
MPAPRSIRRLARGLDWLPLAPPGALLAAVAVVFTTASWFDLLFQV